MMMNDTALDKLLAQWKTERAPQPDAFTSVDHFEDCFLAKYMAERQRREPTLREMVEELKKLYLRRRAAKAAMVMADCSPLPTVSMSAAASLFTPGLKACSMSARAMDRSFEADDDAPPSFDTFDTEEYKTVGERPFVGVATNPLSTFGADVDTAMYANVRRMVFDEDRLPPPEAVRIEELLNYFSYDYPKPEGDAVMRPCFEWGAAPWAPAEWRC